MKITGLLAALVVILPGSVLMAVASEYKATYTNAELAEQAERYVRDSLVVDEDGEIRVQATQLDPRMPARHCGQPLLISIAGNQIPERQATVQIECADTHEPWRLFLPVRIQQVRPVVVARRNLNPGQVISMADLMVSQVDTHQIRDSVFTDPELLVGARVKRRVAANQPVQSRQTCFVCRGEDVTILTVYGNLEIRATGVARADGLLGERIVVRNSRSNKDIQAVVTSTGEVTIGR